jgi:hypothetical protein
MMRVTTSENTRPIFWALLVLALALRLWGIWHVSATDEYNEVFEALRVCSGHLNFERWAKRLYLYVLAGEYGVYFSAGWLFGIFAGPMDFAAKIVRNMEPLFIMGRVTSALAGAASVGVLYRIGERFFDRRTAVIASLLLTFTVFHIDLSQQAKVDATLGLMVLLSFYFILKILNNAENVQERKRRSTRPVPKPGSGHRVLRMGEASPPAIPQVCGQPGDKADVVPGRFQGDFIWAGMCMGLAIQAKINAVVLFVPFGLSLFFLLHGGARPYRPLLGFFVPAFLVGFILGNPPVALAPLEFIHDISGMGRVYTTAVNQVPSQVLGFIAYPIYFYHTMGALVSVLAIAAVVFSLWRPNRHKVVLLSFIVAFYLLMGASRYMLADYYMIPAVPFLYLLIGDLFSDIPGRKLLGEGRAGQAGGTAMAIVLPLTLIAPIAQVSKHELALAGPNTRCQAKAWIEANIPSGSKILMDSGKSVNSFAPPIAENEASLHRVLAQAERNVAAGKIVNNIVDRNALIYYQLLLKTVPEKAYDITSTMFGLQVESIDDYLATGFDYFIISKHMKEGRTKSYFAERHPQEAGFYRSLDHDERIKLIKVIAPTKTSTGGTFYIYRLQHGAQGWRAEKMSRKASQAPHLLCYRPVRIPGV